MLVLMHFFLNFFEKKKLVADQVAFYYRTCIFFILNKIQTFRQTLSSGKLPGQQRQAGPGRKWTLALCRSSLPAGFTPNTNTTAHAIQSAPACKLPQHYSTLSTYRLVACTPKVAKLLKINTKRPWDPRAVGNGKCAVMLHWKCYHAGRGERLKGDN